MAGSVAARLPPGIGAGVESGLICPSTRGWRERFETAVGQDAGHGPARPRAHARRAEPDAARAPAPARAARDAARARARGDRGAAGAGPGRAAVRAAVAPGRVRRRAARARGP